MTTTIDREHFIPYCRADIVEMCVAEGRLEPGEADEFREFCDILQSLVHFEHHSQLESLKKCYRPFNPDLDTHEFQAPPEEKLPQMRAELTQKLKRVLEAANYRNVPQEEIEASFEEAALFKIRLHINFDDYDEVLVYARGERMRDEDVPMWFGLRKKRRQRSTSRPRAPYGARASAWSCGFVGWGPPTSSSSLAMTRDLMPPSTLHAAP